MATFAYTLKSMTGGIDSSGVRSYTRVYQVRSSNLDDEPDVIADLVPFRYYDPYPVDDSAFLKSIRVEPQGDEYGWWTVTLDWDSASSEQDEGTSEPGQPAVAPEAPGTNTPETPPAQRPWVVKWSSVQTERILEEDVSEDEKPVVNSAGQPFDPPVMVPCADIVLSVTAFSAAINAAKTWIFFNKVNADDFMGIFPAGHCRITRYEQTSLYEGGRLLWQTDVTIQIREDGWNPLRVLDAGTVTRSDPDGTGLRYRACVDDLGNAVTSPVPLDGEGGQLAADGELVYLEFQGYYEADFEELFGP